jgi:hypothetical protein
MAVICQDKALDALHPDQQLVVHIRSRRRDRSGKWLATTVVRENQFLGLREVVWVDFMQIQP